MMVMQSNEVRFIRQMEPVFYCPLGAVEGGVPIISLRYYVNESAIVYFQHTILSKSDRARGKT
jgi:hypothetical protein